MANSNELTVMSPAHPRRFSRIAVIGFIAAFVALSMVAGAGPAYRLMLVDLSSAFALLRWGAWTGLCVILIAVVGAWMARPGTRSRGFVLALAGVVMGAAAFGVPFTMLQGAKKSPPIHDITTDVANPPRFVAIIPLRIGSANTVEYQGESISQQQRKAYPDIQPVTIAEPPDAAFKRALDAARDIGWHIVAAVSDEKRIEATDTTIWFGFKDDIVVRITPTDGGSRIDVRSVSRLGRGDLGKNAARIRAYLQRLQQ
jgi:uncharacterized protein (DUF1499 family)